VTSKVTCTGARDRRRGAPLSLSKPTTVEQTSACATYLNCHRARQRVRRSRRRGPPLAPLPRLPAGLAVAAQLAVAGQLSVAGARRDPAVPGGLAPVVVDKRFRVGRSRGQVAHRGAREAGYP